MTSLPTVRPESPWFTLAWFAVLLAVVFTIAFWVGRVAGPEGAAPVDAPRHVPHAAAPEEPGDPR